MILRGLVGAASFVIIAAGGFWVWQQGDAANQAARLSEFSTHRSMCLDAVKEAVKNSKLTKPVRDKTLDAEIMKCVQNGYIQASDIPAP